VGGRGRDIRRRLPSRYAPVRRLRVEEQDPRYREKPFLRGLLSILGVHRCSGLARALEVSRPQRRSANVRSEIVDRSIWLGWIAGRARGARRTGVNASAATTRVRALASAGTGQRGAAVSRLGPGRPHCRERALLSRPGRDCRRVVLCRSSPCERRFARSPSESVEDRDAAVAQLRARESPRILPASAGGGVVHRHCQKRAVP
jgi:hypothetical protein